MSITVKNSTKEFEPISEGSHVARIYQIIHIGTIDSEYQGVMRKREMIRITFEVPDEMRVFNEEKGEQPSSISKEFTLSFGDKSSLKPFIEGITGKKLTTDDLDLESLIGKVCIINVVHTVSAKNGKTYANISGSTPLMKGMEIPKAINPTKVFGFNPFDQEVFNSLPEFLQDKIKSSLEYQELMEDHSVSEEDEENEDEERTLENTPF